MVPEHQRLDGGNGSGLMTRLKARTLDCDGTGADHCTVCVHPWDIDWVRGQHHPDALP